MSRILKNTLANYLTSNPSLTLSIEEYKEYIERNKAPTLKFWKSLVDFAYKREIEDKCKAIYVPLYLDCYALPHKSAKEIVKIWNFSEWKNKIKLPIRGAECKHLDVLDFEEDIETIISTKKCRICKNPINLLTIYIDTIILGILNSNDKAVAVSFPIEQTELEMIEAIGQQKLIEITRQAVEFTGSMVKNRNVLGNEDSKCLE
jgi:hypothetical protein